MSCLQAPPRRFALPLVFAFASGVGYAAAQPSVGLWPLGFVCLLPLLWACAGMGVWSRALLGWVAGTTATLFSTVVPAVTASTAYWGVPLWGGVVIAVSVGQVFGAASFVLAAVLGGDPERGGAWLPLRVGLAWLAAEHLRSTVLTGLPWLLLAHSLAPIPALIQLAAWGGELLPGLALATFNGALLLVADRRRRRAGAAAAFAVVGAFVLAALTMPDPRGPGAVRVADEGEPPAIGSARVRLVQPGLANEWRADPARVESSLARLVSLSRPPGPIDLTVWPENAVNVALPMNEALVAGALAELGRDAGYLLLGTPRVEGSRAPRLYNAAVLLGPDGRERGHHDKTHLLPFAEYPPWPFDRIASTSPVVTPGDSPRILEAGELRVGPLVCYEIVFAPIARALVRNGADVLVNLSNDAWFGTTGAIEQHFAASVLRAVETRRPMLRSTNTGVTAAIDAAGRVVARLAVEAPGTLTVDVTPPSGGVPLSVRLGGGVGVCGSVLAFLIWLSDELVHLRPRAPGPSVSG